MTITPTPPPADTNGIAKLATAVQALLVACGVMSIVTIGTEAFGINAVTGYLSGDDSVIDMLNLYDATTLVAAILSSLVLIATGVLWVIWQYRAAKQVSGETQRLAGWHAGSWFVPIVCLWAPYQNISDLWRAAGRARPSWQMAWWLFYLGSNSVTQLSSSFLANAEDLEQLRVAMYISIAGEILQLVAARFAWLTVRGITQGILQRPPVPAQHFATDAAPAAGRL